MLDFACRERRVGVELEGGQHAETTRYDRVRPRVLERAGFTLLRFWNHEVFENPEVVLQVILATLQERAKPIPTHHSPSRGGLQSKGMACSTRSTSPTAAQSHAG